MPRRAPPRPQPRTATIRESLQDALREGWHTALELSGAVGIPERDVADHLAHVERSLRRGPQALEVDPPRCLACGFVFTKARTSRPGSCPKCRGRRISPPRFRIVDAS